MAPPTHQPTNQTVVAAEADASGNINLLSWNQATNSFNLQLFGANGTLTGSPLSLTKGAQATYDAEFLFNLDLNSDSVQGRNIQQLDESTFHTQNKLDSFKGSNSTNLLQDANSKQLLVAPSANPNQRVELTNADGSPTHQPTTTPSSPQKPMPAATSTSSLGIKPPTPSTSSSLALTALSPAPLSP